MTVGQIAVVQLTVSLSTLVSGSGNRQCGGVDQLSGDAQLELATFTRSPLKKLKPLQTATDIDLMRGRAPTADAGRTWPFSGLRGLRFALPIVVVVALAFAARSAASDAKFTATVNNAGSSLSAAQLLAPTGLRAVVSGSNVVLSWTKGDAVATGYKVLGAALSGGTCGTFAQIGTAASTSYTDSGRLTGTVLGYCYEVQGTVGGWTSATSSAVQATLFRVTSVVVTAGAKNASGCGGSSGAADKLDCGDTLKVTFNQAVNTASGPPASNADTVCLSTKNNEILLETSGSGTGCATNGTVQLGTLLITHSGANNSTKDFAATLAWSVGNTVATVLIGQRTASSGGTPTIATLSTFTPAATLTSSSAQAVCTTSACDPTATGTF